MLLSDEKIFAGTGHRPNKIKVSHFDLVKTARLYLIEDTPQKVISGMAAGFDLAWAEAAIQLSIPLIAAIPFSDQPNKFTAEDRRRYDAILKTATINIISDDYYPGVFQERNIWMVDRARKVVAYWNGTKGGTNNCIKYARKKNVPVKNIWS